MSPEAGREIRWQWILPQTVLAIHDVQLADHGGLSGLRDLGLLESALARPKNLLAHATAPPGARPNATRPPDAYDLAAAYAYGLARNHAFLDGNKRTAYVVARLFLLLHGHDLRAPDVERVLVFERLGKGEVTERELAAWMRGGEGWRTFGKSVQILAGRMHEKSD